MNVLDIRTPKEIEPSPKINLKYFEKCWNFFEIYFSFNHFKLIIKDAFNVTRTS